MMRWIHRLSRRIVFSQQLLPCALDRRMVHGTINSGIHPSAIVHAQAIIGEGVSVGPYCTVGPGVKLGNGCVLHPNSHILGNTHIGDNSTLFTGAVVGADIPGETIIGSNNSIGYHAVVGVKCQDLKYKDGDECFLQIGNNNDIREHASIHRSSRSTDSTVIGDGNLIMGSCHIAHDVKLGNSNILANATLLGGHVVAEVAAVLFIVRFKVYHIDPVLELYPHAAVHQFCHIGSYSFLAAGSMVDRDVPMYMMVAGDRAELRGLNLEGLRRRGLSEIELNSLRRAYQRLFVNSDAASGGIEDQLLELASDAKLSKVEPVLLMLESIRECFGEKRRGPCRVRCVTSGNGIIQEAD